jgi:thiosulfate dehydrogenase
VPAAYSARGSGVSAFGVRGRAVVVMLSFAAACGGQPEGAVARGRALFADPAVSPSASNRFACATCHDTGEATAHRKPGAALAGATMRRTFWGGQENDLLRSVNACLRYFMLSNVALEATAPSARALYAFLESLEPGSPEPVPFTIVREISELPRSDGREGSTLFRLACEHCHGAAGSGAGRLTKAAPVLPEQTILAHDGYSPRVLRLVFIEKTRHGGFLGYGGSMPPFSREVLSDAELAAILEYLGITGS